MTGIDFDGIKGLAEVAKDNPIGGIVALVAVALSTLLLMKKAEPWRWLSVVALVLIAMLSVSGSLYRGIHIRSATYGYELSPSYQGNATEVATKQCEGKRSCDVKVSEPDFFFQGGKSTETRTKLLHVAWVCGHSQYQRSKVSTGEAHNIPLPIDCE